MVCAYRARPECYFSQPNTLCPKQRAQNVVKKGVHQLANQNQVAKGSKASPIGLLQFGYPPSTDCQMTSSRLCTRLVFTGHTAIPRENEVDFLTEAEAAFTPPHPEKTSQRENEDTHPGQNRSKDRSEERDG